MRHIIIAAELSCQDAAAVYAAASDIRHYAERWRRYGARALREMFISLVVTLYTFHFVITPSRYAISHSMPASATLRLEILCAITLCYAALRD